MKPHACRKSYLEQTAMIEDDLMQEIRAARDAYARSFGYDLHAMVADLRARDDRGDWPVVRLAPRQLVVTDGQQSEPVGLPNQTVTPAPQSEPSLGGPVRHRN
jgi:hypothetical protein